MTMMKDGGKDVSMLLEPCFGLASLPPYLQEQRNTQISTPALITKLQNTKLKVKEPRRPCYRRKFTCVPLETGRRIAPAPATFALVVAIDGSREPSADAER